MRQKLAGREQWGGEQWGGEQWGGEQWGREGLEIGISPVGAFFFLFLGALGPIQPAAMEKGHKRTTVD